MATTDRTTLTPTTTRTAIGRVTGGRARHATAPIATKHRV